MNERTTIFLTGASGNMGREVLRCLEERGDRFQVKILIQPEERENPAVKRYVKEGRVQIIWGDLTNSNDVLAGVSGADFVLHVGGMVSPLADRFPALTSKVNVGGAQNIVLAIKAQPDPNRVRLIYIGTVAQTGSRMPPVHWGRAGDPIKISTFDNYAVTKTQAEAIIAESGLRYWVSLRQSAMAHLGLWKLFDPIMFHNPINGVFEWSTARDSGRLLANICEAELPDTFWRHFYNIGGGEQSRVVNHEFMVKSFAAMGVTDYCRLLRPNWFATGNFHGQWFSDSDRLQAIVPFREQSLDDFFTEMSRSVPRYIKLATRLFPKVAHDRTLRLAEGPGGSLHWLAHDDRAHIEAYFGSREAWLQIAEWDGFKLDQPSRTPTLLAHGYDEDKDKEDWLLPDLRSAADFRGGQCLANSVSGPYTAIKWQCALGHEFQMSPNLFLAGGHWCPTCMYDPTSYFAVASKSPYFAQVWRGIES